MEQDINYFSGEETLFDITDKYPETIEIFAANGFPQLQDTAMRELMGRAVSFNAAMKAKKKNAEIFQKMLFEVIAEKHSTGDEGIKNASGPVVCDIAGILPCPVKIPLTESFSSFIAGEFEAKGQSVSYRLKSASGGIGWLEEEVGSAVDENHIPDLFISAGFDLFFDRHLIGKYREKGVFTDLSGIERFNDCFDGLDLKDPKGNYSILAGVPAVFLVNTNELNGRKRPEVWDDLLGEEFENSISLPVEDMDLFNAVILTLLKEKGEEAVSRLGRNLMTSMHPSQMVKSPTLSNEKPAVTVLPWFFTKMVFPGSGLEMVWPKDGAILSPVFIAAKKEKQESLRPIVRFFEGSDVGTLLRDKGYFPSVNPQVENRIPQNRGFRWLGWDYIYSHDISALIERGTELFFHGGDA